MKIRVFLLLLGVLVFGTGRLLACEKTEASSTSSTQKHCCASNETNTTASSCDSGTEHNSPSGCPCSEDSNHCHCPGCGHSGSFFSGGFVLSNDVFATPFIPGTSEQKQAFYFTDHLPEAVYLPIWQPPKIV